MDSAFTDSFALSDYEKSLKMETILDWCLLFVYKYTVYHNIEQQYNFDYRILNLGVMLTLLFEDKIVLDKNVHIKNNLECYIICVLFFKLPQTNELKGFIERAIQCYDLTFSYDDILPILTNDILIDGKFEQIKQVILETYSISSVDFIRSLIYNSKNMKEMNLLSWIFDSTVYFKKNINKIQKRLQSSTSKIMASNKLTVMETTIDLINIFINHAPNGFSNILNNVIKMSIRKFEEKNMDDSHGIYHSFETMFNVLKIMSYMEKDENIVLNDTDRLVAIISGVVHDIIDHKYSNFVGDNIEEQEMDVLHQDLLSCGVEESEVIKIRKIITSMSYSKIKVKGLNPELENYHPYRIVITADLLCGYHVERAMIYNYNKMFNEKLRLAGVYITSNSKSVFEAVYQHVDNLFRQRALLHLKCGEILVESSKGYARLLTNQAIQKLANYMILHNYLL